MRTTSLALFLSALLSATLLSAEKLPREHLQFFESKVRPLLVQHCYKCHAEDSETIQGALVLDSKQGWEMGGDNGAAIVPGAPDESLLIQAVRYEEMEMPPKGKLSDSEVATLEQWVKMGAPDPRDKDTTGLIKREIDIEQGRNYWAFQPPKSQSPPKVQNASWPVKDLDNFVLAKLEAEGINPVADARPEILLRRLYFDLIGLPPTPEQVADFVAKCEASNTKPNGGIPLDVLEEVVDQLLASEQFGQRWGRHWLDVARYAESTGMERNVTFPAAWRYRDYVIASFNSDKPYDQFIQEQIAGDLLPGTNDKNRDERLIATGFLAMGPKSLNERDRNVFVMDVVDEQIDVTTRAVMGVTVSCARCHDHKFDPFPQTDYYALAGIFRSCDTLYGATGGQGNRQPSSLIPLGADEEEKAEAPPANQQRLAQLNKQIKQVRESLQGTEDKKTKKQLQRRLQQLQQQLAQVKNPKKGKNNGAKLPSGPSAMGVVDDNIADCRLHLRGNVETLGDEVPRGFLQVVSFQSQPSVNEEQSGRLELAQYLTASDNPLTARVMANRVWHWLFGQGIVRTVDNFGEMGERPSNPELLDHLATRFVQQDWSVKQLVREIVLSRTYRLASDHDENSFAKDPENLLTWRQNHRRLDAESIRDAMLFISGQLEEKPATSSPVAKMVGVNVEQQASQLKQAGERFQHRSVYLPILRNALPEVLAVFDFAEPSIIVGRRQVTTVPSQALFMMNSDFVVAQSDALAKRLLANDKLDADQRIRRAYRLTLCRPPSADELTRTQQFLNSFAGDAEKPTADAFSAFCQALLASAEFRYIE